MSDDTHDLQFPVLEPSISGYVGAKAIWGVLYLESLILEYSLDRRVFARRRQLGLEDNTEGPVSDDLALGIL